MENTGPGSRGTGHGVRGPGVWKTRGVENAGCGKHGVRVENTGSGGKHGFLMKKHGKTIFSPKYEFSSLNMLK